MKTKRLFFLAAMLLMSVCGFAQSGGGDPLPGDVNEDGVVDVGDIVAVTDIIQSNNESAPVTYKYYLGVISESNLQNQQYVNDLIANSPTTTTNAPITSITLPSGAPTNNGYEHIFIYPSDWGTPTLIDHNTSDVLGLNTLPDANISNPNGYAGFFLYDPMSNAGGVIDITWNNAPIPGDVNGDGVVDGSDITAIIDIIQSNNENAPVTYKYYLGVISEDDIMNQAAVNALINNSSTTTNAPITSITLPSGAPSDNGYEHIFIYPESWGTPSVINHNTLAPVGLNTLPDANISNPNGYAGFFLYDPYGNAGAVYDITWSNN